MGLNLHSGKKTHNKLERVLGARQAPSLKNWREFRWWKAGVLFSWGITPPNYSTLIWKIPSEIITFFFLKSIHSVHVSLRVVPYTFCFKPFLEKYTSTFINLGRWLGTRATPDKRPLTWLVSWRLRKPEVIPRILWAMISVCETFIIRCVCFYLHPLLATFQRKREGYPDDKDCLSINYGRENMYKSEICDIKRELLGLKWAGNTTRQLIPSPPKE